MDIHEQKGNRMVFRRLNCCRRLAASALMVWMMTTYSQLSAAAPTARMASGVTTVELNDAFTGAIDGSAVTVGSVVPGVVVDRYAVLPVVGGGFDLGTAQGEILHAGGLSISAANGSLIFQDFILSTADAPILSGLVVLNGAVVGRFPLFELAFPADFELPVSLAADGTLSLTGLEVSLTAQAATALNRVFAVTTFHEHFVIGTAAVSSITASVSGAGAEP